MTKQKKSADFNFDQWADMAKRNPAQFESMRQQVIDDLIDQAPEHLRQRMEGLQWQIDQIRNRATNPMAACLRISQKMWDNILGERGLLTALQEPERILKAPPPHRQDNVIPLNKPVSGEDP